MAYRCVECGYTWHSKNHKPYRCARYRCRSTGWEFGKKPPWRIHGHAGKIKTGTYDTWLNMKQRCLNPKNPRWPQYGGKGIAIDTRWLDFATFLSDMGSRPAGRSLDRINPHGNYEPSNCRWATPKEQQRNMRNNRLVTFQGQTLSVVEWAEKLHLNKSTLAHRLSRGWPVQDAFFHPPFKHPRRAPSPGAKEKAP